MLNEIVVFFIILMLFCCSCAFVDTAGEPKIVSEISSLSERLRQKLKVYVTDL